MSSFDVVPLSAAESSRIRDEWTDRVTILVQQLEQWAREIGWTTRRLDKKLKDSQIGSHVVPALLLQSEGPTRIYVEPIARSAPDADGVVDLYLMPAYDDIASLYFVDGKWRLHYMFPESPTTPTIRDADSTPLDKESFRKALEAMIANAS
jgi:hypothetical protein